MSIRFAMIFAMFVAGCLAAAWLYGKGGESVEIKIERQNNDAGDKSDQARTDYDSCRDGGGVFDFATSKCRRPAPRGRN